MRSCKQTGEGQIKQKNKETNNVPQNTTQKSRNLNNMNLIKNQK